MIKIRNATYEDREFVVKYNDYVNRISGITTPSKLDENFILDFLTDDPKAYCRMVEDDGVVVGYFIYSYVYWANKGRGVYLSNIFVCPES